MELFVELSEQLGEIALKSEDVIASAESCTAGGIACAITQTAGSSQWFDRGFVTYSNQSKEDLLCVRHETLQKFGAVSKETAEEMVCGALARSQATIAVAVTGIAGPGGAVPGKPVGTVFMACCRKGQLPVVERHQFAGDRNAVRESTIEAALLGLKKLILNKIDLK